LSWIWKLKEKSPGGSKSGVTIWLKPFVVANDLGPLASMAKMITTITTESLTVLFVAVSIASCTSKTVAFEFVDSMLNAQLIYLARLSPLPSHMCLAPKARFQLQPGALPQAPERYAPLALKAC
jgi:hypothetical protein